MSALDKAAFANAVASNNYMGALHMLLDSLELRAAQLEAALLSSAPLTPVQRRSMNDAVDAVRSGLAQVHRALGIYQRKASEPLDQHEIAALMLAQHQLATAEAFMTTVELDWPELLERAACHEGLAQQLLRSAGNITQH